jgi:putative DNA primase/helicase
MLDETTSDVQPGGADGLAQPRKKMTSYNIGLYGPKSSPAKGYITPGQPRTLAEDFGDAFGQHRLKSWRGGFYQWIDTHYTPLSHSWVKTMAWSWLAEQQHRVVVGKDDAGGDIYGTQKYHPKPYTVDALVDAFTHHERFQISDKLDAPCWLAGYDDEEANNRALDLLACRNGLVNLKTGELLDNSSAFFNIFAVDFDYDPTAECLRWVKFLEEILPGDIEAQETLEEMMAYSLSADTTQQKGFLLIGRKRAGKGTVARVLRALIGPENYTGPTLESIGERFGLQPFIGKRVAIVGDARLEGKGTHRLVSRVLSVTGEDAISIDRKNVEPWEGVLGSRVWILSNEPPHFTDATGVIVDRFIPIWLRRSFSEKPDPKLTEKLLGELPGILNRLIGALRRLRDRGHFRVPESARGILSAMKRAAAPLGMFVEDMSVIGAEHSDDLDPAYLLWREWCTVNGHTPGTKANFQRGLEFLDTETPITIAKRGPKGKQRWRILGLKVDPDAEERLPRKQPREGLPMQWPYVNG